MSGNYLRNQTLKKCDMEHYSTSFWRYFRCASSWHSHLIRSAIFGKIYQGTLKSLKKHNTYKIHAYNIQGVFFLRSPKRRRQLRHRRTGLVKLSKISTSNRQYIYIYMATDFLQLQRYSWLRAARFRSSSVKAGCLSGARPAGVELFRTRSENDPGWSLAVLGTTNFWYTNLVHATALRFVRGSLCTRIIIICTEEIIVY